MKTYILQMKLMPYWACVVQKAKYDFDVMTLSDCIRFTKALNNFILVYNHQLDM